MFKRSGLCRTITFLFAGTAAGCYPAGFFSEVRCAKLSAGLRPIVAEAKPVHIAFDGGSKMKPCRVRAPEILAREITNKKPWQNTPQSWYVVLEKGS